jgi:hypothetical protein
MASRLRILLASIATVGVATACLSPPVNSPKSNVIQDTPVRVPQNSKNKVDVLFMIDNSSSMDAMQTQLKARFGDFFGVFADLAKSGTYADLQIGVVTSDFGAGDQDSVNGGCNRYSGGQHGYLQAIGAAAAAGCMPPKNSLPYIQYAFDPNGGPPTSNLPAGQDLVQTFTCMASVGATGCGFEHQLESVYSALKNNQQNAGFIRPDALLTVVFVTNEDDGSAASNAVFYEERADTNVYGAYDTYRQSRFAVECDGGLMPYTDNMGDGMPQLFNTCTAATNPMATNTGRAYDLSRYETLFNQPLARGGIKTTANDVILVGIDGPEAPVQTVLVQKNTGLGQQPNPKYVPCGPTLSDSCIMRLDHSCQNVATTQSLAFFADPAVRLNAVINSAKFHKVASICGDDLTKEPDYSTALQALAQLISSQISPGCIAAPLTNLATPDCSVQDITENNDGTESPLRVPSCASNGNKAPCWKIEVKSGCAKFSPQSVGMTIVRDVPAPANTTSSVECSTCATVGTTCN